jgi:hypothetical protein
MILLEESPTSPAVGMDMGKMGKVGDNIPVGFWSKIAVCAVLAMSCDGGGGLARGVSIENGRE